MVGCFCCLGGTVSCCCFSLARWRERPLPAPRRVIYSLSLSRVGTCAPICPPCARPPKYRKPFAACCQVPVMVDFSQRGQGANESGGRKRKRADGTALLGNPPPFQHQWLVWQSSPRPPLPPSPLSLPLPRVRPPSLLRVCRSGSQTRVANGARTGKGGKEGGGGRRTGAKVGHPPRLSLSAPRRARAHPPANTTPLLPPRSSAQMQTHRLVPGSRGPCGARARCTAGGGAKI